MSFLKQTKRAPLQVSSPDSTIETPPWKIQEQVNCVVQNRPTPTFMTYGDGPAIGLTTKATHANTC